MAGNSTFNKQNERNEFFSSLLGNVETTNDPGKKYRVSFAGSGRSGGTIGRYQADLANNSDAKDKTTSFLQSYLQTEINPATKDKYTAREAEILSNKVLEIPSTKGSSDADMDSTKRAILNRALYSDAGKKFVDDLDRRTLKNATDNVDLVINSAKKSADGKNLGVLDESHPDHRKAAALLVAWSNKSNGLADTAEA